ncbi:Glycoside hydrolase [Trema orientale]|uniref:Glycoside hydrolase n=1 Tax=Trema orientale TaxID=63057 RepID=A0A2P5B5R5_TREOI|nr:Glycoside hydrolase [Trema orientale]
MNGKATLLPWLADGPPIRGMDFFNFTLGPKEVMLLHLSGTLGNNLSAPTVVANFLKTQTTIDRVKIFVDANPNILNAFADTRIAIEIVGLKDLRSSILCLYHAPVPGGACPMPLVIDEDEPLVQETCHFVDLCWELDLQTTARLWIPMPSGKDFDAFSSESARD